MLHASASMTQPDPAPHCRPFVPEMPAGLSDEAAAKWGELVPELAARVRLTEADADRLAEYCETFALNRRAVRELRTAPLLDAGPNGARYPNPLLKIINQTQATMLKIGKLYGLDPASRRKPGKPLDAATDRPNAVLEFLNRVQARRAGGAG